MKNPQLLKGLLEGCILKLISDGETYGYELVENLKKYGFRDISEGTVYPLLIRLKKNKLLNSKDRESPYGPQTKILLPVRGRGKGVGKFLPDLAGTVQCDRPDFQGL